MVVAVQPLAGAAADRVRAELRLPVAEVDLRKGADLEELQHLFRERRRAADQHFQVPAQVVRYLLEDLVNDRHPSRVAGRLVQLQVQFLHAEGDLEHHLSGQRRLGQLLLHLLINLRVHARHTQDEARLRQLQIHREVLDTPRRVEDLVSFHYL